MSRSVSMPLRRLSSPQIGTAPTSSSASRLAASRTESFSPTHSGSGVMMSRAFLAIAPPGVAVDVVAVADTRTGRRLHVPATRNGPAGYGRAVSSEEPRTGEPAAAERVRAAVWARCAGQRGARLDHPFGPETAVFKVADKVFALMSERGAPG